MLRGRDRNVKARKEAEERAQKLQQMIEGSVVEVQKREQKVDEARTDITRLHGEGAAVSATLTTQKAEHETARGGLLEREAGLRAHRESVSALIEALHQARGKDTEAGLGLDHLIAQIQDKYTEDLRKHLTDYHHRVAMTAEDAQHLVELRTQVEKMGDVNLTAIEEFKELQERQTFLAAQEADLSEALDQLRKAIQKINRTSRERFAETFAAVNLKFQEVFPKLFRGGRAHLELTGSEDMLEAGVEIIAQPPGKKLANINQMSGGEKALTAVALIFSIFLVKPSPFCLLDEVDAPLDEANVGKFNDIVKQMSAHSQFILITHNKRTMEVAETLYGVTMEEPGVSKLVSVELKKKAVAA